LQNLLPYKGELLYLPAFLSKEMSDGLFSSLIQNVPWKQEPVRIFGRMLMQPRLTASYADAGISYGYSGITLKTLEWTEELLAIKKLVEKDAGQTFNTALLNYYRNGSDSMGWHRDNERQLGPEPAIASVTLGAERKFQLRNYETKKDTITLLPAHGSLIIMRGVSQQHWEHRLPKDPRVGEARINITFREIIQDQG
jgi:alkylated DNA repair dioxygenase AlkB